MPIKRASRSIIARSYHSPGGKSMAKDFVGGKKRSISEIFCPTINWKLSIYSILSKLFLKISSCSTFNYVNSKIYICHSTQLICPSLTSVYMSTRPQGI